MTWPAMVIRQDAATAADGDLVAAESGSALIACSLLDIPARKCALEGLERFRDVLRAGALPVGSVEFVREAMRLAGICEPQPLSYPLELDRFLGRAVDISMIGDLRGSVFVKPVTTKQFTGFVWHEFAPPADYSEHDLEQLLAMRKLPATTPVWVSDRVKFVSEWRYYVRDSRVVGRARYDPEGEKDAPEPDMDVVLAAIREMATSPNCPAAYGLDMGVLADGRTVMVELNDAWALGHYGRALEPKDYLGLLAARWAQVLSTKQCCR